MNCFFPLREAVTFKMVPAIVHTTHAHTNSNGLLQYYCGEAKKQYQDKEWSSLRKGNQFVATEQLCQKKTLKENY